MAASLATVDHGAFLLAVFSLGLAVPFQIIAASIGPAANYLAKISKYLNVISIIGGIFLNYESLLDYLQSPNPSRHFLRARAKAKNRKV